MGELIQTECRNCHGEFRFLQGIGQGYWSLEDVLCHTQGGVRRALREILDKYEIASAEYGHRLFSCPSCGTLHERFYVRVDYGIQKVYETAFRCGDCRSLLEERTEAVERHRCPDCRAEALEVGPVGTWD